MKTQKVLALSAAIGVLTGLRALTPPAILSQAARGHCLAPRKQPLRLLAMPRVADSLTRAGAGQMGTDKLPTTPSRLTLMPMAARLASGALCGTALCVSAREPALEVAFVGALGAM